ncbi:expressed unknown protein [Seminavis robusta]|uniref:Uncharacterized protein n=1 Tax=Seminavis robusta TaxID=568900 RepID=A0A9N8E621_9STRA|nr:expressed unknown protein [Seminavis robusta]|eukprot:Sro710_g191060.1 n/a (214) ;mRNA; f:23842-24483
MPGSDRDENGCIGSAGYIWCPELQECVQPWDQDCPVEGTKFEGPATIQCSADMRCSASDACLIDMGQYFVTGPYMTGVNGTLNLPEGCTANCTGCSEPQDEPLIGGETDEHGCLPSAGQVWCVSKNQCISATEECPVNGETFEGPTSIQCQEGACSVNKDCKIDMGTFTIGGPYLNGLTGTFSLPNGCTADCTGCQEANDGSGGRRLRGSTSN